MTHPKNTTYQDKRKAALQARAEQFGFKTWSAMLTAIKNGEAEVITLNRPKTTQDGCCIENTG